MERTIGLISVGILLVGLFALVRVEYIYKISLNLLDKICAYKIYCLDNGFVSVVDYDSLVQEDKLIFDLTVWNECQKFFKSPYEYFVLKEFIDHHPEWRDYLSFTFLKDRGYW